MALMETHYYSFSMNSNITLNVFVPTPGSSEQITEINHSEKYDYEAGLPVLYLLHGAYGDAFSWVRYSNIDRYAQEHGIVVVMASAENSFYQDLASGKKYKTFFTEELPTFITNVFPVSKEREKTYIAGFSMGGYGAWFLGLSRPDLYSKTASLSGALDIAGLYQDTLSGKNDNNPFNWEDSFKDPSKLAGSEYDLFALYDRDVANGCVPELYQTVGYDDFLYQSNCYVRDELKKRNADLTYVEDEGGHNWEFWDKQIQQILNWLQNKVAYYVEKRGIIMKNTSESSEVMAKFEQNAKRPFGLRDKIGYAAGDFADNLTFVLVALFMMKFYTDIMGVSAALVGTLMMAAKLVDAFTDVAMGQIVDRSSYTAKGKFAPWVRRFAGPVAVSSFLIFAPYFANMSMGFKVFWMFFTYILWGSVCYTGVNIPYGSMASAMSEKPEERQMLSTWRNIGSTVGQIVIVVILPMLVYTKDATGRQVLNGSSVMVAAGVCAVLSFIVYLVCFQLTTERIKLPSAKGEKNVFQMFGILFTNRAFVGIIVSALLLLLTQMTLTGMNNYIYPNYFNSASAISLSGLLSCGVVLILSTFVTKLAKLIGKKELATIGAFIGAGALFFAYIIHTKSVVVFIALYMVAYTGLGFFNLVCWAMIIDVIDDIEVKKGVRSDGTVYSVYSFARKVGQAGANGITGVILSTVGYTATTAFDTKVVDGIYNATTLLPAIGFIALALALIFVYPLSKKKVHVNNEALVNKRNAEQ